MKNILILFFLTALLTGCPDQEEVKQIQADISQKKEVAVKYLQAKDFSIEGLLIIQDYFFEFSEIVHLITSEEEALKNVQTLIKKKGGAKTFCSNFMMPIRYWESLELYCTRGSFYKCSPEIKVYKNTLEKFNEHIGAASVKLLNNEPACH